MQQKQRYIRVLSKMMNLYKLACDFDSEFKNSSVKEIISNFIVNKKDINLTISRLKFELDNLYEIFKGNTHYLKQFCSEFEKLLSLIKTK